MTAGNGKKPEGTHIAVLATALDYGSTTGAKAELYAGEPGRETPSGIVVTVHDRDDERGLKPGESIPAETRVFVEEINGRWYVMPSQP